MVARNPFVKKELEKAKEKELEKKNSGKKPLTSDINEPAEFTNANVEVEELSLTEIEQLTAEREQEEIEGEEEQVEEEFSSDDSKNICQAMWNIPSVIFGEHLIVEETQTNGFAKQFHIYCIKKGINPYDYFFDEFGLVMAALPIVQYMKKQHTEFKATQEGAKGKQSKQAKEEEERREKEREAVKGEEEEEKE